MVNYKGIGHQTTVNNISNQFGLTFDIEWQSQHEGTVRNNRSILLAILQSWVMATTSYPLIWVDLNTFLEK